MNLKKRILIGLFIFAIFFPAKNMRSHTISGYPSPEQIQALDDDFDNAFTELTNWKDYVDALDDLRDQHIVQLLYLHGQWLGTQSSIRNQQISALAGSVQTSIISAVASAFGIGVKMVMAMYSAYSLEDLMVYEIGQANVRASDIEASWDNSVTFEGTDEANSVMEAYRDLVTAVNHYNSHSSDSKKNTGDPPIKPSVPSLPKFMCGGSCEQEFDTPDSPHYVKCGSGRDVDEEAQENATIVVDPQTGLVTYVPQSTFSILQTRKVSDGCGRWYYNCEDEAEHQILTCRKLVWEAPAYYGASRTNYTCNISYRRCMRKTFDHDPDLPGSSRHREQQVVAPDPAHPISIADSTTITLIPASGSNFYATAGSTHTADLRSSVPYGSVGWRVRSPSSIRAITTFRYLEIDAGDGTLTEASFSYTFPIGVTGTYTIAADVQYSDFSARTISYDVTVTAPIYIADSATRTLAPASGSNYYATVGSTHEAHLTTGTPYASIAWQVRTPDNTR